MIEVVAITLGTLVAARIIGFLIGDLLTWMLTKEDKETKAIRRQIADREAYRISKGWQ